MNTSDVIWHSPCLRGHVVDRNGLKLGYIGAEHVCSQLSLEKAKAIVLRKLDE